MTVHQPNGRLGRHLTAAELGLDESVRRDDVDWCVCEKCSVCGHWGNPDNMYTFGDGVSVCSDECADEVRRKIDEWKRDHGFDYDDEWVRPRPAAQ